MLAAVPSVEAAADAKALREDRNVDGNERSGITVSTSVGAA